MPKELFWLRAFRRSLPAAEEPWELLRDPAELRAPAEIQIPAQLFCSLANWTEEGRVGGEQFPFQPGAGSAGAALGSCCHFHPPSISVCSRNSLSDLARAAPPAQPCIPSSALPPGRGHKEISSSLWGLLCSQPGILCVVCSFQTFCSLVCSVPCVQYRDNLKLTLGISVI